MFFLKIDDCKLKNVNNEIIDIKYLRNMLTQQKNASGKEILSSMFKISTITNK